jgi:hypothetical protein
LIVPKPNVRLNNSGAFLCGFRRRDADVEAVLCSIASRSGRVR